MEGFRKNGINGRRLMGLDASALNRMGVQNWTTIQEICEKIRNLFGLPSPNGLRPILRIPPYEVYLKKHKLKNGRRYDLFGFRRFCSKYGFDYEEHKLNPNAILLPCCPLEIQPTLEDQKYSFAGSEDKDSDEEIPEVIEKKVCKEFDPREVLRVLWERTLRQILDQESSESMQDEEERKIDLIIKKLLEKIQNDPGYLDLGFGDPSMYTPSRLKEGLDLSIQLLEQLRRSVKVLRDIQSFQAGKSTSTEDQEAECQLRKLWKRGIIETIFPIGSLLGQGQLNLEVILRDDPILCKWMDGIIKEAETKVNKFVPLAQRILTPIFKEACLRQMAHVEFPYVSLNDVHMIRSLTDDIVNESIINIVSMRNYHVYSLVETHLTQPQFPMVKRQQKELLSQKVSTQKQKHSGCGDAPTYENGNEIGNWIKGSTTMSKLKRPSTVSSSKQIWKELQILSNGNLHSQQRLQ